jgi:hypothetical protein
MENLAQVISNYVRETRRLESLPSPTETTFYPDLKLLLNSAARSLDALYQDAAADAFTAEELQIVR